MQNTTPSKLHRYSKQRGKLLVEQYPFSIENFFPNFLCLKTANFSKEPPSGEEARVLGVIGRKLSAQEGFQDAKPAAGGFKEERYPSSGHSALPPTGCPEPTGQSLRSRPKAGLTVRISVPPRNTRSFFTGGPTGRGGEQKAGLRWAYLSPRDRDKGRAWRAGHHRGQEGMQNPALQRRLS